MSRAGQATDVLLDNNSTSPTTGNLNRVFAAFAADGVYQNTSQGQGAWTLMAGDAGNPNYINFTFVTPAPPTVGNSPDTPNDQTHPNATTPKGRITLAVPAEGNTPVERTLYAGWLYAAVLNPGGGSFNGLYMTKDFGANWTKVQLPSSVSTFFNTYWSPGLFHSSVQSQPTASSQPGEVRVSHER